MESCCGNENNKNFIDFDNRIIFVHGDIDQEMSLAISMGMKQLEESKYPIEININSLGGSFDSCVCIISEFLKSENEIITNITGVAFSAAAFVFLSGDTRRISDISSLMIHSPRGGIPEDETMEKSESYLNYNKEHYERFIKKLLDGTKVSLKDFKDKYETIEWFITPNQALKLGLANEIY